MVSGEMAQRVERVAARLDLVGPRLAAREGKEAAQTLAAVRVLIQQLADLGAHAHGEPHRDVPVLGAHALGDQVRVLGHELGAATQDDGARAADDVLRRLAALI